MIKKLSLITFVICLFALLSLGAFAKEISIEADELSDITAAIGNAEIEDTVNITLSADIEVASAIILNKPITVNLSFNGKQLSYTGDAAVKSENAIFYLNHVEAMLSLSGSTPLASHSAYTHYADTVRADMVGTGNLISIDLGRLSIENAYLYATNGYTVYANMVYNNDTVINVENSVLRCPQNSAYSAITSKGWQYDKDNVALEGRILTLDNCVVYGGFYGSDSAGHNFNFNYSKGTAFTNTKFYDFKIVNDCWYSCSAGGVAHLMMNSYEDALPVTGCIFSSYDGAVGSISVTTHTGKQNLRLYNCTFEAITGSLSKDGGGDAVIFVINEMPTCQVAGSVTQYRNSLTGSVYTPSVVEHKYGDIVISYPNGFDNEGKAMTECEGCKNVAEQNVKIAPIFELLGYSVNQAEDAVTLGARINNEALDVYLSSNPEATLEFGVYAGNKDVVASVVNGKVQVSSGFAHTINYDNKYSVVDLKLSGAHEEINGIKFVMEFYIYDGSSITLLEKDFDSHSFNEIVEYTDENTQKSRALLETKHKLYYNEDGSFRVLILADLHLKNISTNETAVKSIKDKVKLLVDRVNPNLVIFTGDNTINSNTEEQLRLNIDAMVGYIEEKQIPWCHVYGNHDHENALPEEKQQEIYESYEYCVSKAGDENVTGTGNYVLGVYNNDGTLGSLVYCLDSGTYANGGYDYIREDQIAWYKDTSETLQEYNDGKIVPAIMAFHIPLIENNDAYNNRDNPEIVYEYTGNRNEAICASATDTKLLETIFERGDVKAIVTGHDHVNDYMYNYMGVKLCSSPNISDLTYTNSSVQGGRVFDLNASTMSSVPTKVEYIINRVESDEYGSYESGTVLEDLENEAPEMIPSGYDNNGLNGVLTAEVVKDKGAGGSSAIEVKREGANGNNAEIEILLPESAYGKIGENEYLIVWVDFSNVEFRKACFGILTNEGRFRTDDYDRASSFYYLADGTAEWVELKHGGDGCFGTGDNGSQGINGRKGYFALPLCYMRSSGAIQAEAVITGIYMYLDNASSSYSGVPFYLDNFMIVKDYNEITNN